MKSHSCVVIHKSFYLILVLVLVLPSLLSPQVEAADASLSITNASSRGVGFYLRVDSGQFNFYLVNVKFKVKVQEKTKSCWWGLKYCDTGIDRPYEIVKAGEPYFEHSDYYSWTFEKGTKVKIIVEGCVRSVRGMGVEVKDCFKTSAQVTIES